MDDPPGSRLFIVCGKTAEEDLLRSAFEPCGVVTNVKVIRDKGVAYVKFNKASSAAEAMETLNGAVLNNGRGPKLKVLLADSPNSRNTLPSRHQMEMELACDPDNIPPRSRLFLVVPKTADAEKIKIELNKFQDMEYCKTDLIQSKGVVFCKYAKASSALTAMEAVIDTSTLADYRVKCMLAEPKHKRTAHPPELIPAFVPSVQVHHALAPTESQESTMGLFQNRLDFADFGMGPIHIPNSHPIAPLHTFSAMSGLNSPLQLNQMNGMGIGTSPVMSNQLSKMTNSLMLSSMRNGSMLGTPNSVMISAGMDANFSPISPTSPTMCSHIGDQSTCLTATGDMGPYGTMEPSPNHESGSPIPLCRLRLFVVVHKGVSEEMLARLFRRFAGMEYCDLKKDKKTNRSKGYCYVNYSTHESAAQAVQSFNGIEFPLHSSHRLKVMFAEPLGVKSSPTSRATVVSPCFCPGSYESQGVDVCSNAIEERLIEDAESVNGSGFPLNGTKPDDTQVYALMS